MGDRISAGDVQVPEIQDERVKRAVEAISPGALDGGGDASLRAFDLFGADVLRALAMDMVQEANSGHPGGPCSSLDFAYVLHRYHLRYSRDPVWRDRDRFVLSGGHMSTLLYGLLFLQGRIGLDDLKSFRQLGSPTQGHPVHHLCPGVETTTGPLGQGFANGVGMALGEELARRGFGEDVVLHRTWVLATDGDLQEGLSREAAQLAGLWQLGHLNVFFDSNDIQLASPTAHCWNEDVAAFFRGCHWHVLEIDGHDHRALDEALQAAIQETGRPSMVIGKTRIAKGTSMEGMVKTHGSPLGAEVIAEYKQGRGLPAESFWVPEELRAAFASRLDEGDREQASWDQRLAARRERDEVFAERWDLFYGPDRAEKLLERAEEAVRALSFEKATASRGAAGKALAAMAEAVPCLVGGSADLGNSTKTDLFEKAVGTTAKGLGEEGRPSRGLLFGVREHGMASIVSGLALHGGWLPFGGTFLVFADYLRPCIRLAAISRLPVTYVLTHDSIFLGEDGETHQPVEHIESLRLIPGCRVIRPADSYEAAEAWLMALRLHLETDHPGPVALVLSRQDLPVIEGGFERAAGIHRGGYLVHGDAEELPDVELVASGSEVGLAMDAARLLEEKDRVVRVVSMACREVFDALPQEAREKVLHPGCRVRVVLEAGRVSGWDATLPDSLNQSVQIEGYGQSAPEKELRQHYGFTPEQVAGRVEEVLSGTPDRLVARLKGDVEYLRARRPGALEGEELRKLLG